MRRERLLNLGIRLDCNRPPALAFILEEQLHGEYPERYQRYDKWKRQHREFKKLLAAFFAKEKVDIP